MPNHNEVDLLESTLKNVFQLFYDYQIGLRHFNTDDIYMHTNILLLFGILKYSVFELMHINVIFRLQ
jgi:hypothetical protein